MSIGDAEQGQLERIYCTRNLVISGTSSLVVYRVKDQRLEILRVLHDRQAFPTSLKK